MTKMDFVTAFSKAIDSEERILEVRVGVEMPNLPHLEFVHNPTENFKQKLKYYDEVYNENMELKVFNGIKIVMLEFLHYDSGEWFNGLDYF